MARPALIDELDDGAHVAFDADALIYFVERHRRFSPVLRPTFSKAAAGGLSGHASFLTLLEVLVGPLRSGLDSLAESYRELLSASRGFTLHSVDESIAERAALLRARLGLRTPDSVVAATAIESGCTHLITNDSVFRRIDAINVLLIEDYL